MHVRSSLNECAPGATARRLVNHWGIVQVPLYVTLRPKIVDWTVVSTLDWVNTG